MCAADAGAPERPWHDLNLHAHDLVIAVAARDDERVRAAEDAVERFGSALVLPRTMRSLALGVWAVDLCASQQQQSTRIRAHARELLRTLGAAGADPELRLNVLRAVLRMPGEGSSGELPGVIALGASEMHGDAQITLTAVEAALAGGHWELGFALQRSSCAVAAEGDNERALLLCVEWMWTRQMRQLYGVSCVVGRAAARARA